MKQKELDLLGGVINPEPGKNYKARNGLYYNGYISSADCADDFFKEALKKMGEEIQKEIKLITYPNNFLNIICQDVIVFDQNLITKLEIMKKIMEENNGMGLAANQVGFSDRIFIMKDLKGKIWEFINPQIVSKNDIQYEPEACLSFPGVNISIPRAKQVTVSAQDRNGEEFKIGAIDKEAICIQHEMEHLNGLTFLNNLSRQQKRDVLRKMKK